MDGDVGVRTATYGGPRAMSSGIANTTMASENVREQRANVLLEHVPSVVQITNAVAGVWKFYCDVVALAVVRNRSCRIVGSHRGGYTVHDTPTFDYKRVEK
jgi:hypothetical protein